MTAYSRDQIAAAIIAEGQTARTTGPDYLHHPVITPRGITIGLATGLVESDLTMYVNAANQAAADKAHIPYDKISYDANSDGVFQQRSPWWGTLAERMDPRLSAAMFFNRLAGLNYNDLSQSPGSFAQAVQQSAFPGRYDDRMGDAADIYHRLATGGTPGPPTPVDPNRPDYNEYARWSDNNEDRQGTTVDLWLIHTQEGAGNADDLASFLISTEGSDNPRSYHYAISTGYPKDAGVTVVDVVDTDQAAWAVGNSNLRSINLCFAGSSVSWSTADWMARAGRAIDVAAYLCVQDCIKYGINPRVIPPPYNTDPPGVSDHRYCTQHLRDGNNHDDVGDNFPWPYFSDRVGFYWAAAHQTAPPAPTPAPTPAPAPPTFEQWLATASDRDVENYVAGQLGPGDPAWRNKGATLRDDLFDGMAALFKRLDALAAAVDELKAKGTG